MLHDLCVGLGSIADPVEATRWLAQRVAATVEGDAAVLYVWHAASGRLRLRHTSGGPRPGVAPEAPATTNAGENEP